MPSLLFDSFSFFLDFFSHSNDASVLDKKKTHSLPSLPFADGWLWGEGTVVYAAPFQDYALVPLTEEVKVVLRTLKSRIGRTQWENASPLLRVCPRSLDCEPPS